MSLTFKNSTSDDNSSSNNQDHIVVQGSNGVVCAGHPLTALTGQRMLASGGNAFDAAVAAGIAAAVVEPASSNSLGAECVGQIYHAATSSIHILDGQGVAPQLATLERFRELGLGRVPTGPGNQAHLAFTVPGAMSAYLLMLEKYGTKSVEDVLTPSIEYCEKGFKNYPYMAEFLDTADVRNQFDFYPPGAASVFYASGRTAVLEEIVQPALGRTLTSLSKAAAGRDRTQGITSARDLFYEGDIGRQIVDFASGFGGLLRYDDLSGHTSKFESPISLKFGAYEIYTQNFWTQSPVLLQTLNILENFDLKSMGHNSPEYIHTIVEAFKLAFSDREHYYGDPNFSDIPAEELLSKAYAAGRAKQISPEPALDLPAPGRCSVGGTISPSLMLRASSAEGSAAAPHKTGTTCLVAIDGEGNIASITTSGGVLSKSAFSPDLGFALSTRSEMFFLDEGHPNCLQPGKRPRTTLTNYILCREGSPVFTFSCPGGDDQTQANLQVLLNVLVFGMNVQEAVSRPRFATRALINSFYPREIHPNEVNLEDGIPESVAEGLAGKGHRICRLGDCGMGAIATQRDPQTGRLRAGVDPRRPTCAIAW